MSFIADNMIIYISQKFYKINGEKQLRYLTVAEVTVKWNISERSVRNYCAKGRVDGAFVTGKTWNILENANKPER